MIRADADEAAGRAVADLLVQTPVPIDEFVRQSLSPAIVRTVLAELEMGGTLDRHAGGRVAIAGASI